MRGKQENLKEDLLTEIKLRNKGLSLYEVGM